MKMPSRRELLRGAIGASVLPAMSALPSGFLSGPKAICPGTTPAQTLAVVFHGLFVFAFGAPGDAIDVIVPRVHGHKYWAGNFGQEDENRLQDGDCLELIGMQPGCWTPKFDFPYLNNVAGLDNSKVYCRVILPWPDALMFDRLVDPAPSGSFFSQPSNLSATQQLPTIYAFMYYDGTILSRPALVGTLWRAPRRMGQKAVSVNANLHIRAEHCGSTNENGWDKFSDLFGFANSQRIMLNPNCVKTGSAKGIGTTVPAGEDDFLADDPLCASSTNELKILNSPVNCASIGIGKPGGISVP